MLFCSPIFYRIKTLAAEAPPSWEGEALGVANIQPIVSILVLGCIGLIILIGQSVKHTNSPITQKREPISRRSFCGAYGTRTHDLRHDREEYQPAEQTHQFNRAEPFGFVPQTLASRKLRVEKVQAGDM